MRRRGSWLSVVLAAFVVLQGVVAPPLQARGSTARTVPGMRTLRDLSCRAGGICVGVGSTGQQGAVVLLNAGGPIGPVRVVPGTTALHSVVCSATGSCLAVGQGPTAGVMVDVSHDALPGAVRLAAASMLLDVACPTATTCIATGLHETKSQVYEEWISTPLYVVITNGQAGRARFFPTGTSQLITGIACPTAARCIAVGQGSIILLSNAAGAWNATLARDRNSWAGMAVPTGNVSCPTATVCYSPASDAIATPEGWLGVPAVMAMNADGVVQPALRLSTRSGSVSAISCVASGCMVVGQDAVTSQGQSFHLTAGALTEWTLWANSNYLTGVSCVAAQSCGLTGNMPLYGVFGWRGPPSLG